MKLTTPMMLNLRGIFWLWEELGVVKLTLFNIWEKIRCLGTLKKLWISKISLPTEREDNFRDCFVN